jgi:hypothetical protein
MLRPFDKNHMHCRQHDENDDDPLESASLDEAAQRPYNSPNFELGEGKRWDASCENRLTRAITLAG